MNLKNKNISLQFYDYLCNIIGSEEVVRTRRQIFTQSDIIESTTSSTCISSGSKAEGLDLNGSDYDLMILLNCMCVYERFNFDQSNLKKILLVMDTNDTKPGFTKLKLVSKLYLNVITDWCESIGKETFISSQRYRENHLIGDMVTHGPCGSYSSGSIDQTGCFRCQKWISSAQPWIHRSRTAWPHYTLITAAVQYGVLFVPIGCKNSPNEDLQWRISFSVTEKLLIHSFSHTQLLCYALMKIILKDIIKPKHGELLCSYFIKTIMFWISEEVIPSKWKPENMISCFLDCIRRLIYCVEYKTCLHYFISENNLFEDRFTDKDHKALLDTLRFVYGSPLTSVFQTETFLNYKSLSENSHWMAISASALSCFSYVKTVFYRPGSMYSALKRFKEIYAYSLCKCSRGTLQSSESVNLSDKNKSFYKQYKILFGHFKIGLHSDSVSSWLLLASLFYKRKRFLECLIIINYCLFSCTPDRVYVHSANSLAEQTIFKQMKQIFGLLLASKYLLIEDVCFLHPFCFLPNELTSLITGESLLIPPVVYLFLLQFFCFYHLEDQRGIYNALADLVLTIRKQYFIFPNKIILKTVYKSLDIIEKYIKDL